jgi:hypothetical protein
MMTPVGTRVVLTEFEGRQLFNEQLPLSGAIEREIVSLDGNRWSLLALDHPFDYQVQDAQTKAFRGFEVKRLLIRSRWAGYSVGDSEPTSVFVLIAGDDAQFEEEKIDPKTFYFDAWAMCSNEKTG